MIFGHRHLLMVFKHGPGSLVEHCQVTSYGVNVHLLHLHPRDYTIQIHVYIPYPVPETCCCEVSIVGGWGILVCS